MKVASIPTFVLALVTLCVPACRVQQEETSAPEQHEHGQIVVTSPKIKEVVLTQQYVCLIHSQNHINVCALANGYLSEIAVKEGQAVKKGDVMFKILPTLYQAKLDAELAEAKLAELELKNTERLAKDNVVSQNEVALFRAKLEKAQAKAKQAQAELNFTEVRAPFDGLIDRLHQQLGSLIKEGEMLTSLYDNSVMWVYFNVPERRYFEYKSRQGRTLDHSRLKLVDSRIELVLADESKFDQSAGDVVTVEGKFNNETGNIQFRADFPNPERLLRHGQTGNVLIKRTVRDAMVIPQRATFEILDKRYVFVLGEDHKVHQREIVVLHELDDVFVIEGLQMAHDGEKNKTHVAKVHDAEKIKSGLDPNDKIVLEGVRQVRDGDKVEAEFLSPDVALDERHLKQHAE